jgi:hypothetical protein
VRLFLYCKQFDICLCDVMLNGDFFFCSAHKQDFILFAGFLFVVSIFKCRGYG